MLLLNRRDNMPLCYGRLGFYGRIRRQQGQVGGNGLGRLFLTRGGAVFLDHYGQRQAHGFAESFAQEGQLVQFH